MKPPYTDDLGRPRPPNEMERHTPYIRWQRYQRRRNWIVFGLMILATVAVGRGVYLQERDHQRTECRP